MKTIYLNIAKEFSRFPAGRFKSDGPYSGELLCDRLADILIELEDYTDLVVELDGTMGYGSAFLEEAFGGLVRRYKLSAAELRNTLTIRSEWDSSLVTEVWEYIDGEV
jgi:hypothetical protein